MPSTFDIRLPGATAEVDSARTGTPGPGVPAIYEGDGRESTGGGESHGPRHSRVWPAGTPSPAAKASSMAKRMFPERDMRTRIKRERSDLAAAEEGEPDIEDPTANAERSAQVTVIGELPTAPVPGTA